MKTLRTLGRHVLPAMTFMAVLGAAPLAMAQAATPGGQAPAPAPAPSGMAPSAPAPTSSSPVSTAPNGQTQMAPSSSSMSSMSSSSKSEKMGATTGLGSSHRFSTVAAATAHCPSDTIVWSSRSSKSYHMSSSKYYGKTKHGFYACKMEADAAGFHATKS